MKWKLLSTGVLSANALMLALAPTPSFAQDGASSEEIIVTARRREESAQDVPVSVTTFGAAEIERSGFNDFQDYATQVPNLSFAYTNSVGPRAQSIAIRGVFGSDTTGLDLDETPLPGSVDPRVVDLERIEVLRGPQGTLYGARSMGGTVRLLTRQPDLEQRETSLHGVVSATEEGGWNTSAAVGFNLPMIDDRLALRAFLFSEVESGVLDRVAGPSAPAPFTTREDVDEVERQGGQIALSARLLDGALTVTPRFLFQRMHGDSRSLRDVEPSNFVMERPFDIQEPTEDNWELYTLTANYETGFGDFTSATSLFQRRFFDTEDTSEIAALFVGTPLTPATIFAEGEFEGLSQELRFTSDFSGPLQLTAGLFYQDATTEVFFPPVVIGVYISNLFTQLTETQVREQAAFGEATYQLTDRLSVVAGVRFFDNEVSVGGYQDGLIVVPTTFDGVQSESGANPKFGLQYDINDDAMVFLSASRGFRTGGVNTIAEAVCAGDLAGLGLNADEARSYDSDALWSYEAGAKSEWFDRRLLVNVTASHIDWEDVQQAVGLGGCGFVIRQNAGSAEIDSLELELRAHVTDQLTFGLGIGYTDAVITDGGPLAFVQPGTRLQQVPDWTLSASVDYDFTIADVPWFARASYAFVGESTSALNNSTTPRVRPSYTLVDGRIGARIGQAEIALFVDNLTDENANFADTPSLGAELPGRPRIASNRPRTVGVDLRARF